MPLQSYIPQVDLLKNDGKTTLPIEENEQILESFKTQNKIKIFGLFCQKGITKISADEKPRLWIFC